MSIIEKLNKMQQILDSLPRVGIAKRRMMITFLKHATTVIATGFPEAQREENELSFEWLMVNLGMFNNYVERMPELTGDAEFIQSWRNVQNSYIELVKRLRSNHTINAALADDFQQRHIVAEAAQEMFAMPEQAVVNGRTIQADAVILGGEGIEQQVPIQERVDDLPRTVNPPVIIPFPGQAVGNQENIRPFSILEARNSYWIAQLKSRFNSGVFSETTVLYDQWKADEAERTVLQKILHYLQFGLQGLISLAEDMARGVVKLGFLIAEGACAIIDKFLSLFIKDCEFLQKTIHAVGQGVDDALGQQFYVIKHPIEAVKQVYHAFMLLYDYMKSAYNSENGFINTVLADAKAEVVAAYEFAENNPYETIRKISCLATHITIAVLIGKYLPRAFNPGPTGPNNPAGILPPVADVTGPILGTRHNFGGVIGVLNKPVTVSPTITTTVGAGGVAAAPVAGPAIATAQTLGSVSTRKPHMNDSRSIEEYIKSLLEVLDIFEFTDEDDASAIQGLRQESFLYGSVGKKLYGEYLNNKLQIIHEALKWCDEDDEDDRMMVQELRATQLALESEIESFVKVNVVTDFFAKDTNPMVPDSNSSAHDNSLGKMSYTKAA